MNIALSIRVHAILHSFLFSVQRLVVTGATLISAAFI